MFLCVLPLRLSTRDFFVIPCGETGIRTPETLLEFTRFPGVPLQPLEHLSHVRYRPTTQFRLQRYYKKCIYANFNCIFLQIYVSKAKKLLRITRCNVYYRLRRSAIHIRQHVHYMNHPSALVSFSTMRNRRHIRSICF